MSKCFGHKTTFLDTHRLFRPAIEISRIFRIVCDGVELKKSNLKNKHAWIRSPHFELFHLQKTNIRIPFVKKARAIKCTIQNWDCIWIVHSITLVFDMDYKVLVNVFDYVYMYIYVAIYLYTYITVYVYIYIERDKYR